jgi:hypothetical protein
MNKADSSKTGNQPFGDDELAELEREMETGGSTSTSDTLGELQEVIVERCDAREDAKLLSSMLGVSHFTATALACRVADVSRFPRTAIYGVRPVDEAGVT